MSDLSSPSGDGELWSEAAAAGSQPSQRGWRCVTETSMTPEQIAKLRSIANAAEAMGPTSETRKEDDSTIVTEKKYDLPDGTVYVSTITAYKAPTFQSTGTNTDLTYSGQTARSTVAVQVDWPLSDSA